MKKTGLIMVLNAGVGSLFAFSMFAGHGFATSSGSPNQEPEPILTYEDVAPILAANCQSCHSNAADMGLGGISVDTKDEVLEHGDLILKAVETGWMPYEDPEWHLTPDGQKLISWLKSVVPAEPDPVPSPAELF